MIFHEIINVQIHLDDNTDSADKARMVDISRRF